MSCQKEVLREIAAALSSQSDLRVGEWFTENFKLHDPTAPDWPPGHFGASQMLARTASLGPTAKLEALDMVEEGDRVAVRWQLLATREGKPFNFGMMTICRFEDGRIAEDWGAPFRGEWP